MDNEIKITAEFDKENSEVCKFTVDRPVYAGKMDIRNREQARGIPLAEKLFQIEDVAGVSIYGAVVVVTRGAGKDWKEIGKQVGAVIRDYIHAGMTPTEERDPMGGLLYELSGGTGFAVFLSSGKASGTHTQMALEVPDLDAAVKDLRARGLKFEEYDSPGLKTRDGIAEIAGTKVAWFKDSEGNLIAIGLPVPVAATKGS